MCKRTKQKKRRKNTAMDALTLLMKSLNTYKFKIELLFSAQISIKRSMIKYYDAPPHFNEVLTDVIEETIVI